MTSIPLPRLLDGSLQETGRLSPLSLSITKNLMLLSTAVMTLPPDTDMAVGQLVELFTAQGSAGVFRVEQVERCQPDPTRITLTHGLSTLSDGLWLRTKEGVQTLPAAQLFRDILARQSLWQPGSIDVPEDVAVTWQGQGGSLLEALLALMQELPEYCLHSNQSVTPWQLHLLRLPQEGLAECRLSRNLHSLSIETDRSKLCTQLYLPGREEPLHADTIHQWGVVSRMLSASEMLTEDELLRRGQQYLEQHKNPEVTITMEAMELSRITGSALDCFRLGLPCRVCLPQSGVTLTERIVSIHWPDVYATPDVMQLTLANQVQTTAGVLAGLIVESTQVRQQVVRQGDAISLQAKEISLQAEKISQQAQEITLRAHRGDVDALSGRVASAEASITLNAQGILSKVSRDEMISTINQSAESIRISASRIDLDGYVTMKEFQSLQGTVNNLWSDRLTVESLSANTVIGGTGDFDNLVFGTLGGKNSTDFVMDIVKAQTSLSLNGSEVATKAWVQGQYLPAATITSNYATQRWASENFQLKSGLTTKEITVVTGVNTTKANTPPFYNQNGTQVSGGISYVKSVTYNTETYTVVVFA